MEELINKIISDSAYFSRERRAIILLEEITRHGLGTLPPELLKNISERFEKEKPKT